MTASLPETCLQLQSLVTPEGELRLSLAEIPVPRPGPDEVVLRVEAAPLNPSDVGLLVGPADAASARAATFDGRPGIVADVPAAALAGVARRLGRAMPVGNEGAGVVVAAGSSAAAQALLGKTVAVVAGAMYSEYRCVDVTQCLVLRDGTPPAAGASAFINPLTALGMVETMRREGHKALVHTAAASNLGQMLNRICIADGVGLVNIVRKPEQEALLRGQGARHVVNSASPSFQDDLVAAIEATGATLAFDAIGGGRLASQILTAMEAAASRDVTQYSRYGTATHKQVYLYGSLDRGPTEIVRNFGMAWSIGGWLVFPFLQKIGPHAAQRLRERVAAELGTTFASHYTREVTFAEALEPDTLRAYCAHATGEKFLLRPAG